MTEQIEAVVREYIGERYLSPDDAATFRNDDDLLVVLDSLQILRMLIDLESKFAIRIANSELAPENLGTVSKLARLIERKLAEKEGAQAS